MLESATSCQSPARHWARRSTPLGDVLDVDRGLDALDGVRLEEAAREQRLGIGAIPPAAVRRVDVDADVVEAVGGRRAVEDGDVRHQPDGLAALRDDREAPVIVGQVAVLLEATARAAGRLEGERPERPVVVGVVRSALEALDVGGRERPQVDQLAADHAFATGRSSSAEASGCQQATS